MKAVSAQLSNKFGYCPSWTASIVLPFNKRNSLPHGLIQALISNLLSRSSAKTTVGFFAEDLIIHFLIYFRLFAVQYLNQKLILMSVGFEFGYMTMAPKTLRFKFGLITYAWSWSLTKNLINCFNTFMWVLACKSRCRVINKI